MLPILPDYLTNILKTAGQFARFLRETDFSDTQAIADLEEISSRKGLGAAYARTRANQGFLSFAEVTLRSIYNSPAFDKHVHSTAVSDSGHKVPRLRYLLPNRPEPEVWQSNVLVAFAEALRHGKDPVDMIHGYFHTSAFAELGPDKNRAALFKALCEQQPTAALILLEDYKALQRFPHILTVLLRFGAKHFNSNRYFERTYELSSFHKATFGLRGSDVNIVLERLWYSAFRTGRHDEALETLRLWAALRPTLKRVMIYQAIVTSVRDPEASQEILEDAGAPLGRALVGGNVLYAEQALRMGKMRAAEQAIRNAIHEFEARGGEAGDLPRDYLIALHNVLIARDRPSQALNMVLSRHDLNLRWSDAFGMDSVEDASAPKPSPQPKARVAIVMTAFCAEAYLERAMAGILGQSHDNLELIVVDDCSDDQTAEICRRIARDDARLTYMRTPRNMGTYAAKNLGIREALTRSPDFITLCDSDDFWMRNHISEHLDAMATAPGAVCSMSQWIRVRDDGSIEAGLRGRYVENCPHSTFFRANVFERTGLFDTVRFGADREFMSRVSLHFGQDATINIPRLLTLGRRHDASLTTSGAGAVTEFNESPVRLDYWRSWNEWHIAQIKVGGLPHTEGDPDAPERPFDAPSEMYA